MGPSMRDQCALLIVMIRFYDAMAALWSGGVNVGTREHDAGHLSLLV